MNTGNTNEEKEVQLLMAKKPFKERFLDSWNKTDQHCEHCGAVTVPAKGINRQNIRRLTSFSTNPSDWLVLFMIIMVLVGAYAYNSEIAACKELRQQTADSSYKLLPDNIFLINDSMILNNDSNHDLSE